MAVLLKETFADPIQSRHGIGLVPKFLPRVEKGNLNGPVTDQLTFGPDGATVEVGPGDQYGSSSGDRCLLTEDIDLNFSARKIQPVPGVYHAYRWAFTLDWIHVAKPFVIGTDYLYQFEIHPTGSVIPQASPKVGFGRDGNGNPGIRLWVSGGPLTDGWRGSFIHDGTYPVDLSGRVDVVLEVLYGAGGGWPYTKLHVSEGGAPFRLVVNVPGLNLIKANATTPPPGQYPELGHYRRANGFAIDVVQLHCFAATTTFQEALDAFPLPPPPDPCAQLRADLEQMTDWRDQAEAKIAAAKVALQ